MKKILLSVLTLTTLGASAQIVNIPDANFKAYLVGNTAINTGGDPNEIEVSEATAFTGQIYCPNQSITDLTGIEAFTSLDRLIVAGNVLNSIDISSNLALTDLNCSSTSISSLDVSLNTSLSVLNCSNNNIGSLNLNSNTVLESLFCGNNQLSILNVTNNTQLLYLGIDNNSLITSIDLSQCPLLTSIDAEYTGISSINISNAPLLESIYVGYCSLSSLDVTNNIALQLVECQSNQITSLDFSLQTALFSLICSSNQLTSLNLQNGNNTAMSNGNFYAAGNINLTCIQVDDVSYSTSNWTHVGSVTFSTNCGTVGVKEVTSKLDLNIYPNPTTGKVTFSTTEQINSIEIYNLTGQKVTTFNNTNTIDISNLSNGVYFAKIITATNNSIMQKIIKE